MFYFNLIFKISIVKSIYYSFVFKTKVIIGKNCKVIIGKNAKLQPLNSRSSIYLGVHMNGYAFTVLELKDNASFFFGKSVCVNHGCKVVIGESANLTIGDRSFLNEGVKLYCMKNIKIGEDCAFAWDVTVIDSDMHAIYNDNKEIINPNKDVIIGDKVWIGTKATILKGTRIANNVIVAAGSKISQSLSESNNIYSENGKRIKVFSSWK